MSSQLINMCAMNTVIAWFRHCNRMVALLAGSWLKIWSWLEEMYVNSTLTFVDQCWDILILNSFPKRQQIMKVLLPLTKVSSNHDQF